VDIALFKKLVDQQIITEQEFKQVEQQQHAPVTVYWDVTTLLYIGVLLLSTGLGILIYEHIDSIGHAVILSAIGLLCAACFVYCFKKAKGFSYDKVEAPNVLFDYVLLLGCLLMLTFVGYLQFTYNVFGNDWGLATFVPMVLLFFAAYYFDHLGVLSIAITNLAAWAGFTVAPLKIIGGNNFTDDRLILTGIVLGYGLIAFAYASVYRKIKIHFAFTWKNFGIHILFISLLAAIIHFESVYLLWFIGLAIVTVVAYLQAMKERSFYFLVVIALYAYVGFSYVFIFLVSDAGRWSTGFLYLAFIYFIASGIGLIRLLIHYNKLLKHGAHL
jgi:hypothetical protein